VIFFIAFLVLFLVIGPRSILLQAATASSNFFDHQSVCAHHLQSQGGAVKYAGVFNNNFHRGVWSTIVRFLKKWYGGDEGHDFLIGSREYFFFELL